MGLLDRYSSAYASNQYRALQQFFGWLAAEEEVPDPMAGLKPPRVPGKPVSVFTAGDLPRLERAGAGRAFAERRDTALIAVFRATGIRLPELAGIRTTPTTRGAATSTYGTGRSPSTARAARPGPLADCDASVTRLMDAQETTLEVINRWWFGAHPPSGRTGGLLNFSDQAQTLRWVVAERANLLASVDSGLPGAGAIAQYLGPLLQDVDVTADTKGEGAGAAQAPLDRYADARHCFEIQYRTAEHRDGPVHQYKALALRQMAGLDCRVARYEQAKQQYREAAEASQAGKDYYGLAMSLKGLGSIGRLIDDYPLAVDSLREAIALLEPLSYGPSPQQEIAVVQLAYSTAELADVLTKLHRFDAALALLARAADLQRALKNDLGLAGVYWHQGDVLRQTGKFGAARDRFNAALALNRKRERPDVAAQAQWGLAQVEKDYGNPALAAAMFAELAALWRGWGDDLQQARMLLRQADAERLSKQWHDARTHFDCARELCLRCADLEGEAEAHEGLAKIGAATGDDSAGPHRKAAIALYRQISHPKAGEL